METAVIDNDEDFVELEPLGDDGEPMDFTEWEASDVSIPPPPPLTEEEIKTRQELIDILKNEHGVRPAYGEDGQMVVVPTQKRDDNGDPIPEGYEDFLLPEIGTPNVLHNTARLGSLAFELVLDMAPVEDICKDYQITQEALIAMMDKPAFKQALKAAKAQIDELGPTAGFALRNRAMAEDLLLDLYIRGKRPTADTKTVLQIFETFAKMGKLDPSLEKKDKVNSGVSVNITIGAGIRGLEHLQPQVIDAVVEDEDE